jgi:malonyl-CoA O-methyltransferase
MTTNQRPPTLDPQAVARWQRTAPAVTPWLHEEVARRMLDRLQWIKLEPAVWAHWGAVRGGLQAHTELAGRYARAQCFAIETQPAQARQARLALTAPWWTTLRQLLPGGSPALRFDAPEAGSLNMLWANMALHESADPQALLAQWHRLLAVEGFVMFSCLGPDTAREVREIYDSLGWPPAGHQLTDMHDWGDMLVQTGFAEPVMDMERITLTYETPARLLHELRELGRNFHPARFSALRGRQWQAQLEQLLSERLPRGPDGRLQLTLELIYGHAFKARPKVKVSALSAVSVQDMRSMLQDPRGRP